MSPDLAPEMLKALKIFQRNEITEYHIYPHLTGKLKNKNNATILE